MSVLDPSALMRDAFLAMSRQTAVRDTMVKMPVTNKVVSRYVPGEDFADAVRDCANLVAQGRTVTVDHLGEDITDLAQATATKDAYLRYIKDMSDAGLSTDGIGPANSTNSPSAPAPERTRISRGARRVMASTTPSSTER